jgi:hypothetical protein
MKTKYFFSSFVFNSNLLKSKSTLIKKACFILLLIFTLNSCDLINPDEKLPVYFKIDSIKVETGSQYPQLNNITDVWVTVNGDRVGTFELPALFPVIAEGKTNVVIMPGIKVNGIAATRDIYPFFDYYEFDTTFIPVNTYNFTPVFKYKDNLFMWTEHFPGIIQGYKFEKTTQSDTIIIVEPDTTIGPGNYTGNIYLTVEKPKFQCTTIDDFVFPTDGRKIYAELDYKNNQEFEVGLFTYKSNQVIISPLVIVNPHPDSYNRIYIDLTSYVNANASAYKFKLYIGAEKPDTISSGFISIDNVAVIYNQ